MPVAGSEAAADSALSALVAAALKSPNPLDPLLSAATGEKIKFAVPSSAFAGVVALSPEGGAASKPPNAELSVAAGDGDGENGELSKPEDDGAVASTVAAAGEGTGENGEFPGTSMAAEGEEAGAALKPPKLLSSVAAGEGEGENGENGELAAVSLAPAGDDAGTAPSTEAGADANPWNSLLSLAAAAGEGTGENGDLPVVSAAGEGAASVDGGAAKSPKASLCDGEGDGENGELDGTGTAAAGDSAALGMDRGAESKLLNALNPLLSVASGEKADTEGALGVTSGDGNAFGPSSESGAAANALAPPVPDPPKDSRVEGGGDAASISGDLDSSDSFCCNFALNMASSSSPSCLEISH